MCLPAILCTAKILLTPPYEKRTESRGTKMISRKRNLLSAAVVAVALIATVAVARTVHTHTAPADQVHTGKVIGTVPDEAAPYPRHGIIVCGGGGTPSGFGKNREKVAT